MNPQEKSGGSEETSGSSSAIRGFTLLVLSGLLLAGAVSVPMTYSEPSPYSFDSRGVDMQIGLLLGSILAYFLGFWRETVAKDLPKAFFLYSLIPVAGLLLLLSVPIRQGAPTE
jgi:hypothetical protein